MSDYSINLLLKSEQWGDRLPLLQIRIFLKNLSVSDVDGLRFCVAVVEL